MVPHALLSHGVEYIAFIVVFVIVDYVGVGDWEYSCCWCEIFCDWIIVDVCLGYPYILLHHYLLWVYSHSFVVCVVLCSFLGYNPAGKWVYA